jgi:hypothetical protein
VERFQAAFIGLVGLIWQADHQVRCRRQLVCDPGKLYSGLS